MCKSVTQHAKGFRVLYISQEDLSENNSGAKIRNRSTVEAFRRLIGVEVIVAQPSRSNDDNTRPAIRKSIPFRARLLALTFDREYNPFVTDLPTGPFDLIVVSYTYYAYIHAFVRRRWPSARIVLDCHNIETDLKRQILSNFQSPGNFAKYLAIHATEKQYFRRYDELWLTSETDRHTAVTRFMVPKHRTRVIPNSISMPDTVQTPSSIQRRVVFFGWMGTEQNHETGMRLHEIYRRIQHESWCPEFYIAGKDPSSALMALSDDRFHVLGGFASLSGLLTTGFDLLVMPMDLGGGTRLKVLDAAAAGLPVLSTAKGVEGLDLVPNVHYLRAESTDEFVKSLRHIYTLPTREALTRLENLAHGAFTMMHDRYSVRALSSRLAEALAGVPT